NRPVGPVWRIHAECVSTDHVLDRFSRRNEPRTRHIVESRCRLHIAWRCGAAELQPGPHHHKAGGAGSDLLARSSGAICGSEPDLSWSSQELEFEGDDVEIMGTVMQQVHSTS